jgi:hypothetical protein
MTLSVPLSEGNGPIHLISEFRCSAIMEITRNPKKIDTTRGAELLSIVRQNPDTAIR